MSNNKTFYVPLAFVGLFFFSIGFALGINSFLMPVLKCAMDMSAGASSLLLAATFVPFLLFGIPATKCIEAIGYKRTMALSFSIFAVAFALFILAAKEEFAPSYLRFIIRGRVRKCDVAIESAIDSFVESRIEQIQAMVKANRGRIDDYTWELITGAMKYRPENVTLLELREQYIAQ